MAVLDNDLRDPSVEGTSGLSGLRGVNTASPLSSDDIQNLANQGYNFTPVRQGRYDERTFVSNVYGDQNEAVGVAGLNDSRYDSNITSPLQLEDLNNTRAEMQPWYLQLGAGIAKGTILAGTTFLDGTIGTIIGIGNAAKEGTWSGFWDNPFSQAMQSVNEWSEEAIPNYYSNQELENPWYNNIFTANFIGDKLIKNLGFAVGAYYSGSVYTGGLSKAMGLSKVRQAYRGAVDASGRGFRSIGQFTEAINEGEAFLNAVRITDQLAKDAQALRRANPILQITGGFTGALGESRIEAINTSKDWFDLKKEQLDDYRNEIVYNETRRLYEQEPELFQYVQDGEGYRQVLTPEGQRIVDFRVNQQFDYDGGLEKLAEDRTRVGNVDFLLNVPLLTVSDIWQFGKMYAGGYRTARQADAAVRKAATESGVPYEAIKPTILHRTAKVIQKGIAEGPFEEMGQATAGELAGLRYSSELNSFYGAKIDPDAESETVGWMQAMAQAIANTYGDIDAWEEGFIGGMTGILGVPGFRSTRSRTGGFQSPVYFQGGAREDLREIREETARREQMAEELNARFSSPEFLNYYQGAIRHNKFQRDMDDATDIGDNFLYKNAEHGQLISDAILFNNAGRIQDFYEVIDGAADISLDQVEEIRQLTTDTKSGRSVYEGMTDQEVVDAIQQRASEIKNEVDTYRQIAEDVQVKVGDVFEGEELEELTWMLSQIDNWENRFQSLQSTVRDRLREIVETKDIELINNNGVPTNISDLINLSPTRLINTLASSPRAQQIIAAADALIDNNVVDGQSLLEDIADLGRIAQARRDFVQKYNGYISNPELLRQNLIDQDNAVLERDAYNETAELRNDLNAASSLQEFRDVLNNSERPEYNQTALNQLQELGNPRVRDYNETNTYNDRVNDVLRQMNLDESILSGARNLFDNAFNQAQNLDELSDINSSALRQPELTAYPELDLESNTRMFEESLYALQSAMGEVNAQDSFRNRFAGEYSAPAEVIPSTDTAVTPPSFSPPVGEISTEDLVIENKEVNENIVSPRLPEGPLGARRYYRPSIPELHLRAVKEGDFRPFNQVVSEREPGVNFDDLYNYLRDNQAFNYVNQGNLRVGDEINFMIDPEFNENTIFMVTPTDNGGYQIVGSIDENHASLQRYEGLPELRQRILEEYTGVEDKSQRFIATPTSRVSQVMVGKIPFSNQERNLADIPNTSDVIFGIIKNGTLSTNGVLSDGQIVKPKDLSNKEGRMYILIPAADNKYRPAAVRVKHFNRQEFNPSDNQVLNSPLFKNIERAVEKMARAQNEDNVREATQDLSREVYLQDLYFHLFTTPTGDGIRISKVQRDDNGSTIKETLEDGSVVNKEETRFIFFNQRPADSQGNEILFSIGEDNAITSTQSTEKSISQIRNELINTLLDYNLPIQVNLNSLNKGVYNDYIINSGIATSNLQSAEVKSSWFVTDYFDSQGNLQASTPPTYVAPTNSGPITNVIGSSDTPSYTLNGSQYTIDERNTNTVFNSNGVMVTDATVRQTVLDLAYVQKVHGESQNGVNLVNGFALLPNGAVINKNSGEYLTGQQKQVILDRLEQRSKTQADTNKIIGQIEENQKKVNKEATDSNNYYVLEEDGEYHPYSRVHTVLGENWAESEKTTSTLNNIRSRLYQNSSNPTAFNDYLKTLENTYKLNLTPFMGKVSARDRDTVVNVVRDKLLNVNSMRALDAGSAIDSVIRNFFVSRETPIRPENLAPAAFDSLLTRLNEIKESIEQRGERFLANNVVVFNRYPDGTRVAGELDILSVDSDGNFRIYDVKTSRFSFYPFTDSRGNRQDYFNNKARNQRVSTREYYTKQLSSYKNLFESQYNVPVVSMGILPFVLQYNRDNSVSSITKEKGIPIEYQEVSGLPKANALKQANPQASSIDSSVPIFNTQLETSEPTDLTQSGANNLDIPESRVGYYELDGNLRKNIVAPIGQVGGVDIYMAKESDIFDFQGEPTVGSQRYLVVLPNGFSRVLVEANDSGITDSQARDRMLRSLNKNPQKVSDLSSSPTSISRATVVSQPNQDSRAQDAVSRLASLQTGNRRRRGSIMTPTIQSNQAPTRIINTAQQNSLEQVTNNQNNLENTNNFVTFAQLDSSIQSALEAKGWSQEKFDEVSQEEKEHAVKCIS